MSDTQTTATCRWAVPTLFLDPPTWLDAIDRPWTCVREDQPHEIESTNFCRHCGRWEPRSQEPVSFEPCDHLHAQPYFLDIFAKQVP